MVTVEIRSAQHPAPVATIVAGPHGCRIDGSQLDLIDVHEPLLGLPSGRRVTVEEAPEEWARGLIVRYRSPDLTARIVHDDDPLPAQDPPIRLDEPAPR
jgi:hypothetical protein